MIGKDELKKMREELLYAVGKYSDYRRYAVWLDNLAEQYDETVETYHFDVWMGESRGTIAEKAQEMLDVTQNIFSDLEKNAEQELYSVVEKILELNEECQRDVWGMFLKKEGMTEDLFGEMLIEWEEQPYVQQEALDSFIAYFKEEAEFRGMLG